MKPKLLSLVVMEVHRRIKIMAKQVIIYPGQRVITNAGVVAVVAFEQNGKVFVYNKNGIPVPTKVVSDAWGGEMDQTIGLAA
jgi:hypothetical protein